MAVINGTPIVLSNYTLSVLTDDYAKLVSKVEIAPSPVIAEFVGGKPDAVFQMPGATKWVLNITFAQDWATTTSLSNYLFTNSGLSKTFTFQPVAGGKTWTVTAMIVPGSIGGDVNSVATATVSLPVIGQPAIS